MRLSALERKVLNSIQQDIPLAAEPFKILSQRLGIKEAKFIKMVKKLKKNGVIRSFAAGLNHRKLKFRSTLLALKVPSNKVESIAKEITVYPEVTHCYLREGEYNLWAVFLYRNGKFKPFLNALTKRIGRENILNLRTKRQFKLKTRLKI